MRASLLRIIFLIEFVFDGVSEWWLLYCRKYFCVSFNIFKSYKMISKCCVINIKSYFIGVNGENGPYKFYQNINLNDF